MLLIEVWIYYKAMIDAMVTMMCRCAEGVVDGGVEDAYIASGVEGMSPKTQAKSCCTFRVGLWVGNEARPMWDRVEMVMDNLDRE